MAQTTTHSESGKRTQLLA
uniref:Uncharacterized protein n=1 Tax=Arundo donax TaxID=35708 RepID=A0A0A9HHW9_ARUDO